MSILVHPDKNLEDKERAQVAFEGGLTFQLLNILINLCRCLIMHLQVIIFPQQNLRGCKYRSHCAGQSSVGHGFGHIFSNKFV